MGLQREIAAKNKVTVAVPKKSTAEVSRDNINQ